jgi:hypothetical protein
MAATSLDGTCLSGRLDGHLSKFQWVFREGNFIFCFFGREDQATAWVWLDISLLVFTFSGGLIAGLIVHNHPKLYIQTKGSHVMMLDA